MTIASLVYQGALHHDASGWNIGSRVRKPVYVLMSSTASDLLSPWGLEACLTWRGYTRRERGGHYLGHRGGSKPRPKFCCFEGGVRHQISSAFSFPFSSRWRLFFWRWGKNRPGASGNTHFLSAGGGGKAGSDMEGRQGKRPRGTRGGNW